MKKLNTLLAFVLTAICILSACSDDETKAPPFLEISKESINFRQTANVSELEFKTNAETVEAIVGQGGNGWCDVSVLHNADTKLLKVTVSENSEIDLRSTIVDINAGGVKKTIAVCQMGQRPTILVSEKSFSLSHQDTTITMEVISNCEFEIVHDAEWINKTELTKGMDSTMYAFRIDRHPGIETRSQEIVFREAYGDAEAKVYVEQQSQDDYTGGDPSTITGDIMLTVARSRTSSYQNGEGIEKSHDGDKETIYHSAWNNSAANYFPITLEYEFDNEPSIDYLVYYPRQSGSNGNFKEVEIWISTEENPTFVKAVDHDFKGSGSAAKVELGQSYVKPTAVKFVVKSGAGDRVGFASCSEMEFYRKNPDAFDPLTIFTDEVCTELRSDVTQEMIDTISAPYFKTMAQYMLDDRYPRDFRIADYKAYRHPDIMANINKTSPYSLRDNPTGIYFKAGEEVVIMMGDTHGASVSLQVQNLAEGFGGNSYPLSRGLNKFTVSKEGLGYIMYFTDTAQEETVKIHIASGTVQGYYDPDKHDLAKWNKMLNNSSHPYIDVLGKFSHLTYPVESFKNYCSDINRLVQVYDSIVYIEHQLMGLYKYEKLFDNRMYFHVVYGDSYMYATSYRTAYHEGTLSELCDPNKLRSGSIWGPAHEVGHCNQTRPGLKWPGMTEVTNNIHSLNVQSTFGNPTRLQAEDLGGTHPNRYQLGFTEIIAAKLPHNKHGDVFCKLIPFWQLQLYAKHVKRAPDFYADLHEMVRTNPDLNQGGANQLQFVRWACDVMHEDLTDFFEAWGFLTPVDFEIDDYGISRFTVTESQIAETKNYIASKGYSKPDRIIQYMHDDAIEAFKAGSSIGIGNASKNGRTISMTNWKNVAVYEVYSGNEMKMISHFNTFTLPQDYPDLRIIAIGVTGSKTAVNLQ